MTCHWQLITENFSDKFWWQFVTQLSPNFSDKTVMDHHKKWWCGWMIKICHLNYVTIRWQIFLKKIDKLANANVGVRTRMTGWLWPRDGDSVAAWGVPLIGAVGDGRCASGQRLVTWGCCRIKATKVYKVDNLSRRK